MTTAEFVRNFYIERKSLLNSSFDVDAACRSYVSLKIEKLGLDDLQKEKRKHIIASLLTDTFYAILLGLDGSAGIGEMQEPFKIYSEDGTLLSDSGALEAAAYDYFILNRPETENSSYDFLATLTYSAENNDDRQISGSIDKSSLIKFYSGSMQTMYSQQFIEWATAFPGDEVTTMIKLHAPADFYGKLDEGMNFEILQEGRVTGKGRILNVINEKLRK